MLRLIDSFLTGITMHDPTPADTPPLPQPDPVARASWVVCIVAILVTLVATVILVASRESVVRTYEDYDMELPGYAIFVLNISPPIFISVSLVLIGFMVVKEFLVKSSEVKLYMNLALFLGVVIFYAIWRDLQYGPMNDLMHSVIGG